MTSSCLLRWPLPIIECHIKLVNTNADENGEITYGECCTRLRIHFLEILRWRHIRTLISMATWLLFEQILIITTNKTPKVHITGPLRWVSSSERVLAHSRAPLFTQPCPHCSHSRAPGEQWARLCVFTLQGCVQAARLCRGSPVVIGLWKALPYRDIIISRRTIGLQFQIVIVCSWNMTSGICKFKHIWCLAFSP